MIACRSLFRVNSLLRVTSCTYSKSKPLLDFQKCKFWHGFVRELNMDARNGIDRRKRRGLTQTWRAVSTQPDCSEGDGERAMLQNRVEEVHCATSTVSIAECEKSNVEVLAEPVKIDVSLDGNLTPPEKHSLSLEIGASLMRFIKGKGGDTQKKIQSETGVEIIFPLSKKEDSIILEGNSAESITQASEKIQTIIDKAVSSRDFDYTHFVSLPLAIHPELVDKLVDFQNKILGIEGVAPDDKDKNKDNDSSGDTSDLKEEKNHSTTPQVSVDLKVEKADAGVEVIVNSGQRPTETPQVTESKDFNAGSRVRVVTNIPLVSYPQHNKSKLKDMGIQKSIFIKPKTFHLTVLMLKLWNKERVKAAAEVLQNVSSKVKDALENRPISIRLKGLNCLRGTKERARVLYIPVEEIGGEGRLLRACQVITDAFVDAGLVIETDAEHRSKFLKLHATLMNGRHRRRKERSMEWFDARGIFELYGSEEWGNYALREAHLSERFVFDENEYYHCCASIPFPQNKQVE